MTIDRRPLFLAAPLVATAWVGVAGGALQSRRVAGAARQTDRLPVVKGGPDQLSI